MPVRSKHDNDFQHSAVKKQEGFDGQQTIILPKAKQTYCTKHEFCNNLYITDIGYYPHAAFHNRIREKGCPQYILIHCVKGKGWYSINGKIFKVKANEFFIIPKNTMHEYGADMDDPWSIYWLHFSGVQADFYYDVLTKKKRKGPQIVIVNTIRVALFYDIMQHLQLMNDLDNLIYSCGCLYAYLSSYQTSEIKISDNTSDIVHHCINYMKENLDKNLTLSDISKSLSMSASHLSAIFKKRMKYSPINLFTTLKIQKACEMLMDGSNNIKTIAFNLGYDDPYHFSRVFKKVMGVSPKNFK